ncbi:MAG: hypothetical protein ABWX67_16350 [Allosphingosinicella sp.]
MRILALLALISAAAAAAQPAGTAYETVATAQRAEDVPLRAERRVAQERPIVQQSLVEAGGAYLRLPPAEEKAFRERHRLGKSQLSLTYWLRDEPGGLRHIGWLYCGAHIKMFSGQIASCFRDTDGDGRLDQAAAFNVSKRDSPRIDFAPIDPAPYESWTWDRIYRGSFPKHALPYLTIEYDFDEARGRLLFRARAYQIGFDARLPLHPIVEVDPASLPTEIEIGDAKLSLIAWDGKRVTLRVDRTIDGPLLLEPPEDGGSALLLGKVKGYRLRIMDMPLPPQTFVRPAD